MARTPLSVPVTPAPSEPPVSPPLFNAVIAALRWAWERLRAEKVLDPMVEEEEAITDELHDLLNRREDGRRCAVMLHLFETVHRDAQLRGGGSFRNSPDLTVRPKEIPRGVRNQSVWAVIVECKIIATGTHATAKEYCDAGVQRFLDGRYSAQMARGVMVGYVRNGRKPAEALGKLLVPGAYGVRAFRPDPDATDVAYSHHDRYSASCVDVELLHLWLDAQGTVMPNVTRGLTT